ncbi:MAG: hypothetical protein ACR2OE_17180 [Thermomicrobiales bacterium]
MKINRRQDPVETVFDAGPVTLARSEVLLEQAHEQVAKLGRSRRREPGAMLAAGLYELIAEKSVA